MLFPPVYKNRELYSPWPAEIHQLVQSRSYCTAGVEDVIDKNDTFSFDVFGEFGAVYDRIGADCRKVVAVKCDVDYAVKWFGTFVGFDLIAKTFG